MLDFITVAFVAIFLLFLWSRDRAKESQRRIDDCSHPPERQITIRVNNILHPMMLSMVLPGRRWLKKHCEVCGWQRHMYAPSQKPYEEYIDEFDQETIDREAEFHARLHYHELDKQHQENLRKQRRKKGMK